jgi:prepilin-type N-terminal cleavage/methylation domain-containing protein
MRKGFTILELLIVIAIISILAAVVLVALNQSREKGKDSALKAQLAEARKQSELYYESMDGKYCDYDGGTSCFWGELNGSNPDYCGNRSRMVFDDSLVMNPNTIGRFITAAEAFASPSEQTKCFMDEYGARWVIAMKLNNLVDGWWCIDSVGMAKLLTGSPSDIQNAIVSNSVVTFSCP